MTNREKLQNLKEGDVCYLYSNNLMCPDNGIQKVTLIAKKSGNFRLSNHRWFPFDRCWFDGHIDDLYLFADWQDAITQCHLLLQKMKAKGQNILNSLNGEISENFKYYLGTKPLTLGEWLKVSKHVASPTAYPMWSCLFGNFSHAAFSIGVYYPTDYYHSIIRPYMENNRIGHFGNQYYSPNYCDLVAEVRKTVIDNIRAIESREKKLPNIDHEAKQ